MKLELINGDFSQAETINLITQMYQVKIKFHEDKVKNSHNEEDIKMRERKIKLLQNNLSDARVHIKNGEKSFHIHSDINL